VVTDPTEFEQWIFGSENRRFTQDSPVLPEVWVGYAGDPEARQDLLLTPHQHSSAARLMSVLSERLLGGELGADEGELGLAYNEGYVVAWLDFHQLVREVVPLSQWWTRVWPPKVKSISSWVTRLDLEPLAAAPTVPKRTDFRPDWLLWYLTLIGRIELGRGEGARSAQPEASVDPLERWRRELEAGAGALDGLKPPRRGAATPLWSVNINRLARTAVYRSRLAVKADAAERVFAVETDGLRWAIVDTGVDATHPAFRRRASDGSFEKAPAKELAAHSRVLATYDFTQLRPIVSGRLGDLSAAERKELEQRVQTGQALDWDALKPLLAIPHDGRYEPPVHAHGTHIAGIVGADWRLEDPEMPARFDLKGICPSIELYDLRVFGPDGTGEEFAISAALQFVRHLNGHSDLQVVHGANLSLAIPHDLANYAVGRTPICDECERLSSSGAVVVAAAGNDGLAKYRSAAGPEVEGFRTVAITDPGNAEAVITVGSTHRQNPHTYGVSYFSSRGPTGDGRLKPDLVAPGEKITSPAPGEDYEVMDGTSQATAHVSGVAAMLMARHPELQGQPRQVKEVLCATATDLGRERYFQGAGLIDALRALQEV
jgi:serine protease AprX